MTPEGKVKESIKKVLKARGLLAAGTKDGNWPDVVMGWYYMPVPNGLGVHGIPDFVGCYKGRFFGIEAKAPGKAGGTTINQEARANEILAGGGSMLITDTSDNVEFFLDAVGRAKRWE